ncbi:MAG: PEP/pyruvate-binding domain-containing protein [Anaerolinea sp.]|nr:PEP/pyruvate-binding domain-containing protein [Anaerolinea sp.]
MSLTNALALIPNETLARVYLALAQYPILSERIRARMRRALYEGNYMTREQFECEVKRVSVKTQENEGLQDPYFEEAGEIWEVRQQHVRDLLTDVFFIEHFTFEQLEKIINEVLAEKGVIFREVLYGHNPEQQTVEQVLTQALQIQNMPAEQRARYDARLQESKVVLIRSLISDQLPYIHIAKEWFTLEDLADIRQRKIGHGRIGGKAAGMLLAYRILMTQADEELRGCLKKPESYYIGSDEMYSFMAMNELFHWNDQKYKSEPEMRAEYPQIQAEFEHGRFAVDISEQLRDLLDKLGNAPLIVRSSSLLEDSFGTAFPGKYESVFCPNQGSLEQNLRDLQCAIARVYASTLNPNALLYRRSRGLQDYDERMGLLLQVVQGGRHGRYFLPHAAGVAFSRNLYRWAPQIRREDGFVRLVWGLGTRAVDRVGNDYPRLVALSHPTLRPSNAPKQIQRYSQQYVDVLDLEDNAFKTLPISEVLKPDYPPLRYLAQLYEEGDFSTLRTLVSAKEMSRLVLTFDQFLTRTPFAERMRSMLRLLEQAYHSPLDLEFTVQLSALDTPRPKLCIAILQCRPQSQIQAAEGRLPNDLRPEDILFSTRFVVPRGHIQRVDYALFVPPEGYFALKTPALRSELVRAIGRLNAALKDKHFVCFGPGRWGSSNPDLGVSIDYGDIYNAHALIELAGEGIGLPPEPSLGTHFFQDLLEAQIYPLAIYLDDAGNRFERRFFYDLPDHSSEFISVAPEIAGALRLLRVSDYRANSYMRIVMDDDEGRAIGFLEQE